MPENIRHHIAEFHADPPVIEDILCRLTNNENSTATKLVFGEDGSVKHVLISSNVYRESGQFCHTVASRETSRSGDCQKRKFGSDSPRGKSRWQGWATRLLSLIRRGITFMNSVAQSLCGWAEAERSGHPRDGIYIVNERTRHPSRTPLREFLREGNCRRPRQPYHPHCQGRTERPIDDSAPRFARSRKSQRSSSSFTTSPSDTGPGSRRVRSTRLLAFWRSRRRLRRQLLRSSKRSAAHLGWDLGALWIVDEQANVTPPVRVLGIRPPPPSRSSRKVEKTHIRRRRRTTRSRMATGQSAWLENASDDKNFRAPPRRAKVVYAVRLVFLSSWRRSARRPRILLPESRPAEMDLIEAMGTVKQTTWPVQSNAAEPSASSAKTKRAKPRSLETALDASSRSTTRAG